MSSNAVGIGILGFGGFAMFAAQQFTQVPGTALRYIARTHREASLACAKRFGFVDVQCAEALFAMPDVRVLTARHKTYEAYQRITLTSVPAAKMTVYGDLLRAMLTDQLAFIAEPSHTRVITEDNGRESLRMSVQATQLAMS